MRTGYLSSIGHVEVTDFEIPSISDEEVLIKVKVAGICGSDVHAYHGTHPFRKPPMILGHEVAGEIVKVGPKVTNVKVGDRVTVEPTQHCGKCTFCLEKNYHLCRSRVVAGTGGWRGTFADYFAAPGEKVYVLPESMDYDLGLLVEPLAVGVHAVELSRLQNNENALVIGTGPIGLLTAVASQFKGAKNIVCTDINEFRLTFAQDLGFKAVNVSKDSVADRTKKFAPDGFDVVLLTVSSTEVIDQALQLVRRGGRLIIITLFTSKIPFDMGLVQLNEIELKGSMLYTKEDFVTALEILSSRDEELKRVVTHHVALDEVNSAMKLLTDFNTIALKIGVKP